MIHAENGRYETTPWFVNLPPRSPAPARLVAYPHAGAGCSAFAELAERLAGRVEIWAVDLPGRQSRFLEPVRTELPSLVSELADAFSPIADRGPYAMLGYCSGALLAYETVAELHRRQVPPPTRLIIVSFDVPARIAVPPGLPQLPSDEFWEAIVDYGGIPVGLTDPDMREIFEPALRGDFALLAGFTEVTRATIDVPITAALGSSDPSLSADLLRDWSGHTTAGFRLRTVDGGHWLLEQAPATLADLAAEELGVS